MQTLSQLTGVRALAVEKPKDKQEPEPQPTFFQKHLASLLDGSAERAYDLAKSIANQRTAAFANSLRDPNHPQHNANVARYTTTYAGDLNKAADDILSTTSDELNAPSPEDLKEDPNYERKVADQHKPKGGMTHEDVAFHNILLDNLKKSRDARGYGKDKKYDKDVIDTWKIKYNR